MSCHHCKHTHTKQRQLEMKVLCGTAQEIFQSAESQDRLISLRLVVRRVLQNIIHVEFFSERVNKSCSLLDAGFLMCPQCQGRAGNPSPCLRLASPCSRLLERMLSMIPRAGAGVFQDIVSAAAFQDYAYATFELCISQTPGAKRSDWCRGLASSDDTAVRRLKFQDCT